LWGYIKSDTYVTAPWPVKLYSNKYLRKLAQLYKIRFLSGHNLPATLQIPTCPTRTGPFIHTPLHILTQLVHLHHHPLHELSQLAQLYSIRYIFDAPCAVTLNPLHKLPQHAQLHSICYIISPTLKIFTIFRYITYRNLHIDTESDTYITALLQLH